MSSQSLRRVLAGTLVTAFLSLGGPAAGEASGFLARPEPLSFWACAWQWLMAQISQAEEERVPAPAAVESDRNDAGWILDPNG
jgi:hypothetical protein